MQVRLYGTAPNEAARFRVVNLAGGVADSARVRDRMDVTPVRAIEAPRFSLEMLRNTDGFPVIGLLPATPPPDPAATPDPAAAVAQPADDALRAEITALAAGLPVSDMLETAAFAALRGLGRRAGIWHRGAEAAAAVEDFGGGGSGDDHRDFRQ